MKRLAFLPLAIGFAVGLAFSTRAAAAPQTGVDLLEECQLATMDNSTQTGLQMTKAMHCMGYLSGVMDSYLVWEVYNDEAKGHILPPACFPDHVTLIELARVVVKFLNDHPNKLHEEYGFLVISALRDAYPCTR